MYAFLLPVLITCLPPLILLLLVILLGGRTNTIRMDTLTTLYPDSTYTYH